MKKQKQIRVNSPQYKNHEWEIFPFLFESKKTNHQINWENSEF